MSFGLYLFCVRSSNELIHAWLREYNPEDVSGQGSVEITQDPLRAKRYPSFSDALTELDRVPENRPTRSDGKPNRPLSAYIVLCIPIPNCG